MKEYISIETLLKEAEEKGIDFGKGDPYNRLRYYTKIGWIPHMVRKKGNNGSARGHYPKSTIDRLLLIQEFKNKDLSNEEISQKLKMKDKAQSFYSVLTSTEVRTKLITYASFLMILIILLAEMGFVKIGEQKNTLIAKTNNPQSQIQILDSGTAYIAEKQKQVFVKTDQVYVNSKIYVTFKGDYAPATRYWVSKQVAQDGFVVELDVPTEVNSEFDWWVSN